MRLQIIIDSATTKQVRELQQAYHEVATDTADPKFYADFGTSIEVKVNGPEHWSAKTPMLPEGIAAEILDCYSMRLRALGR